MLRISTKFSISIVCFIGLWLFIVFFSSRRRHTRYWRAGVQTCALPIYDVQPVDPLELWEHPPFEPTRVETPAGPELHARGAIDDKGNVAFHLLGMRAHLAATGRDTPAVTVKLIVEGEEESGSPHFADLLREHADRLASDVVVVSDTGMAAPDVPSAGPPMRGL